MASRSEQRKRQRRNRIISLVLLIVIVGTSPWWSQTVARVCSRKLMTWHDHFRVKQVLVTGVSMLTEETVRDLAKIPSKQSMFNLPFNGIEKRIVKNPWVKTVSVKRRLPDTVELQITERIPVVAVRGERLMVLTADSIAISPPAGDWVWDLPLLSPPRSVHMESGVRIKDEAVLAMLQQAARARSVSPEIWKNISELYFDRNQIHGILAQPYAEVIAGKGVNDLAWIGLHNYLLVADLDTAEGITTLDLRIPGKLIVSQLPKETAEHEAG